MRKERGYQGKFTENKTWRTKRRRWDRLKCRLRLWNMCHLDLDRSLQRLPIFLELWWSWMNTGKDGEIFVFVTESDFWSPVRDQHWICFAAAFELNNEINLNSLHCFHQEFVLLVSLLIQHFAWRTNSIQIYEVCENRTCEFVCHFFFFSQVTFSYGTTWLVTLPVSA